MTRSRDNKTSGTHAIALHSRILAFHKVCNGPTFGVTNFRPGRFFYLIERLQESGYRIIPLRDALSSPHSNHVAITFDDGYAHLVPILTRLIGDYNVTPTVFMPTGYIGRDNSWDYSYFLRKAPHLGADEIKHLAGLGTDFQSHSHQHQLMNSQPDDQIRIELTRSRDIIANLTGQTIDTISYPFGRSSEQVRIIAGEEGYKYGLTMRFPRNSDTLLASGRFPIYSYDSIISISRKISGNDPLRLEYMKARFTNSLSAGTDLLNRIRRRF